MCVCVCVWVGGRGRELVRKDGHVFVVRVC